jgi:hypothetical protein
VNQRCRIRVESVVGIDVSERAFIYQLHVEVGRSHSLRTIYLFIGKSSINIYFILFCLSRFVLQDTCGA